MVLQGARMYSHLPKRAQIFKACFMRKLAPRINRLNCPSWNPLLTTYIILLQGCIFPAPINPQTEPKPFKSVEKTEIISGATTREEVVALLRKEPAAQLTRFNDDDIWIYSATRDTAG